MRVHILFRETTNSVFTESGVEGVYASYTDAEIRQVYLHATDNWYDYRIESCEVREPGMAVVDRGSDIAGREAMVLQRRQGKALPR